MIHRDPKHAPPSRFDRRHFLKTAAVAALGFPTVVPPTVFGQAAPSNRITLGLIGMGFMMTNQGPLFLNRDDVQVLAVCDVDSRRRERAKAQVDQANNRRRARGTVAKTCDAFNEFERVVGRDDIDAVVIATPDHWHAAIALAAMRRGKDVYVQRPLCLTVREGRWISDAARQYGTILQVGSQLRSERGFRKASEIVRNGWIGKVHTICAVLGDYPPPGGLPEQPVPEGFDYDRWLGPAPWAPYHEERVRGNQNGGWRRFWEYGLRRHGDSGAMLFDIIQWALGMDESGPVEFIPKGYKDAAYQTYVYADGTRVLRDKPTPDWHALQFIGAKGEVVVSRGDRLQTTPRDLKDRQPTQTEIRLYESNGHEDNWIQCIKTRKQPVSPAEVGHRTATFCQLSALAERLKRPIKWDPKKEEIAGDPEAARWLDRPRRAPYVL